MKRLLSMLACALLAAGFAAQALADAGYVHELTGTATVRVGNAAAPRPLKVGDIIDPGQTIATGEKSTAIVKFEDGQIMTLAPSSAFTVTDYAYNKQNVGASRAAFNLLQGGLRFISGVIGATNPRSHRLTAGTATIGIRGTDGIIIFNAVANIVNVAVSVGTVDFTTPAGTQSVTFGNASSATGNAPPVPPVPRAQMAAVLQAAVAALAAQNVPVNTPVVVKSSAAAVAAQGAVVAAQQAGTTGAALQALQDQAATALNSALADALTAIKAATDSGATLAQPPAPPAGTPPVLDLPTIQQNLQQVPSPN